MPKFALAICAMFRDEAPYFDEWISFHRDQGVEHFFLYDHGSTDGSSAVLRPYIESGLVDLTPWPVPEKGLAQRTAYDHCLAEFGKSARWIAFIDLDEFLFSPEGGSLAALLGAYEDHAGVFVFWQCYGSSGHRQKPAGLVTDSFTRRARSNWHRNRQGKSIVDPRFAVRAIGPHYFIYRDGTAPVTEAREPVQVRRSSRLLRFLARLTSRWWPYFPADPYSYNNAGRVAVGTRRLRINHYLIKSLAEYRSKMDKNNATKKHKTKYNLDYFRYHDRNEVEDAILRGRVRLGGTGTASERHVAPD